MAGTTFITIRPMPWTPRKTGGGWDTTNEMNAGPNPQDIAAIFDFYDDGTKGAVDYDPWLTVYAVPGDPTLDHVTTPTTAAAQSLSGTKDADTAILVKWTRKSFPRMQKRVGAMTSTLAEGRNPISIYARSDDGSPAGSLPSEIVRDTTAPQVLSSVPADGEVLNRMLDAVVITLFEQGTSIDGAATLADATVQVDGGVGCGRRLVPGRQFRGVYP